MRSMSTAGAFRMIVATTADAAEAVFGCPYVTSPRLSMNAVSAKKSENIELVAIGIL